MIALDHLTKTYGNRRVVDDVSLVAEQGELVVLLGMSGCGKTTTLKMINRLVEPTSGSVSLDGRDVSRLEPYRLRRRIGYVFQRIGLFPHLTVRENIAVTPTLLNWDPERIRRRVDELLELVELDAALGHRSPASLSGGQQQRVGVARALAAEPSVMLLDEPFGALDPITRDRLQRTFLTIRRQLNLTAIFVTHDMVEALLLADRIVVMKKGRIVQQGAPADVLREPADAYVERMVGTPKRQVTLLEELMAQGQP